MSARPGVSATFGATRFGVAIAVVVALTPAAPRAALSRTVNIRTEDGVALGGTFYEAERRPAPAVILLHMLTRTRDDWQSVAASLADAGVHALAIDFRGHGVSPIGPPGPDGGPDWPRLELDVRAARVYLAARSDLVRPSAIGILGASIGANAAIVEAAADPGIASLALLSAGVNYRGLRTTAAMQKYGARPALFVASTDDPYALRSMHELAGLGGGIRDTRTLTDAGHGTMMLDREKGLVRTLVDWFQRTLL